MGRKCAGELSDGMAQRPLNSFASTFGLWGNTPDSMSGRVRVPRNLSHRHLSHELEEMRMMDSDPSEASQEMLFKDSETEKPSAYLVHGHMRTFFVSILLLDGYEVEYDGSNGYPSARWIILSHKQRT